MGRSTAVTILLAQLIAINVLACSSGDPQKKAVYGNGDTQGYAYTSPNKINLGIKQQVTENSKVTGEFGVNTNGYQGAKAEYTYEANDHNRIIIQGSRDTNGNSEMKVKWEYDL